MTKLADLIFHGAAILPLFGLQLWLAWLGRGK
jgi:hypothetical protein